MSNVIETLNFSKKIWLRFLSVLAFGPQKWVKKIESEKNREQKIEGKKKYSLKKTYSLKENTLKKNTL